jgi:hypothetical protein
MKIIFVLMSLILLTVSISAQSRTNDVLIKQVKSLRAEKSITVSFNEAGNSSKIMAVTDNFSDSEAHAAGVQAMNFAVGFFYPGKELAAPPNELHLAFWVLSKKPRFAESHGFKIVSGEQTFDLGDGRYAAKPREDMEYLNFSVTREDLSKLAQPGSRIQLGNFQFTLTPSQVNTIKNLLTLCSL